VCVLIALDLTQPHEPVDERDPELSAPDLFAACKDNRTDIARQLLEAHTPPTYIDVETGVQLQ
jgi:hypothetical protein